MSRDSRKAQRVCAIGGATLDLVISYEDMEMMRLEKPGNCTNYLLLAEGHKIEVSDLHYFSGGGATNAAVTFKRQGLDVFLFCKIGQDAAGKVVLDDLHKHNLNTDHFQYSTTTGTSSSFVVPALSGDRTIFAYRGANAKLLTRELPIDGIKNSDFVYVTSLSKESAARLPDIVKIAAGSNVPVAVNPGISQLKRGTGFLRDSLSGIDTLMLNYDEAKQLMVSLIDSDSQLAQNIDQTKHNNGESGADIDFSKSKQNSVDHKIILENISFSLRQFFRHMLDEGVNQVIVTKGSDGVYIATADKIYFHDILKGTKIVNTLGAGDAFAAGFASCWYQGGDIKTAIISGMLNSAAVIEYEDAKSGALNSSQLAEQLKQYLDANSASLKQLDW